MSNRRLAAALVLAGSNMLYPGRAAAADPVPSLDLRRFEPPTDPSGGLRYEPASSPATLDFNTALWLSHAYRPVTLRAGESNAIVFSVIDQQLSGDFIANVGLFERVALGVDLPFVLFQRGDDRNEPENAAAVATLGHYALPAHGLGDMKIALKATIVKPTSGDSGTPNAGFSLALVERFGVPTGGEATFLGEGHISSETRVLADYDLIAIAVHGALGVKLRAEHEDIGCVSFDRSSLEACPTRVGHELPFGMAISLKPKVLGIDEGDHWTWFIENYGHLPLYPKAPFHSETLAQVQLGGGARYLFDNDLSLLAGIDFGLVGGVGSAPVRTTLALGWAPRKHDADDDGVLDKADECPEFKEDRDGFEDGDGCPDIDNDDDGVKDSHDRCDGPAEDMDGFQDGDGCPDPDNDGDGILDVDDHCPEVVGIPSSDPVERGCPDLDPDKDGIRGEADRCPSDKEDLDGFQDGDGCPDPDNDEDGIHDADDRCIDQAGSASPNSPEEHGCPDGDGDGIRDGNDACPDEKGVRSDDVAKNGCPEAPPKKRKKPLVTGR